MALYRADGEKSIVVRSSREIRRRPHRRFLPRLPTRGLIAVSFAAGAADRDAASALHRLEPRRRLRDDGFTRLDAMLAVATADPENATVRPRRC